MTWLARKAFGMPRAFLVALLSLGALLAFTTIPGIFMIDDDNYLVTVVALRQGQLKVPNTAGLTPSRELLFFDPGPASRVVESTPVTSTAPPLYAPLALPFSWFGLRGLIGLNTIAYLLTGLMVFLYAQRYSTEPSTPWLAAVAFSLGGYVIEYAQGVWPHALSIALCTGGIVAVGRTMDEGRIWLAGAAGFLLALAAGVRYQNAVLLVAAGAALALWGVRRWRTLAAFGLAASIPLFASAAMNHERLGSWNPVSKGQTYLSVPLLHDRASSLVDPLIMFWARVVDFAARPPLVGRAYGWMSYDEATGAHLMLGIIPQKALLQSAPWAVLAFALFAVAWSRRFDMPEARRRQTRLLAVVTMAMLGMFAFSGVYRHEGLSFNQRYLLELLPLLAVAFAWALDDMPLGGRALSVGLLWGILIALVVMALPLGYARFFALLKVPVAIAAALGAAWTVARQREKARSFLTAAAGVALAWGLVVHLGDDVSQSRSIRSWNRDQTQRLRDVLPDRSALITYWGSKDAAGPLLLDRDIVILDTHADEGKDAPALITELLERRRRVFVLRPGFPDVVLSRVFGTYTRVPNPGTGLTELRAGPGGVPSP
jgi:hypothetical protein